MNRRKFVKRSIYSFLGLLISPSIFKGNNNYDVIDIPNYKPNPNEWNNNKITISWIGHATVLMNFYGTWILTDPVFFERVGVYFLGATWGPTRYTAPAITLEQIPKPDLILLSHSHMDHTDYYTLKEIAKKYPSEIDVVSSHLSRDVIEELPWKSIKELDWNEEFSIHNLKIKAYEVKHFGWRFPWEEDRSKGNMKGRSYNAYVISKNGKKVLFGGDTAYTEKLDILKDEQIDAAIMPIGAYRPWRKVHCNPEEALIMADRINAKYFIPIHCSTFQQGREPREEPLNWLNKSISNYKVKLGLNEIGQTFSI